ncbi:NAD(P)/FAD-dependent oxidoreductase [Gilvibacter sediminis]|uniref:NAD(P)/FAD-dependent oxidoreductase n=1 Tax=Gilvibacter sediminis TaxID=379071 RepID=UPI0023507802|nr:NAD(P)/FAD-dependent oxidoreductase [Gilvibacter sediminis]MDC7998513.1 NAD(P)/FAD-dependent oxidoreductase [Gilvibacter sediminis]
MKQQEADVLIVGGGLAGLSAAIDLSVQGKSVLLFEPKSYPRHKVCGEYISNEVLPYLSKLGIDPFTLGAVEISNFSWTHPKGKAIQAKLPLGGFGISRFTLEQAMFQRALAVGVQPIKASAENIESITNGVQVKSSDGNNYTARAGIAAYGKRSVLDKKLAREFISKKANYVAAKWHAQGAFDPSLVALHNFEGGYCGVSRVEEGLINFCFIASYKVFKNYRDLPKFMDSVLRSNPHLKELMDETEMVFEKPLSIAQISFKDKPPVEGKWIMCGDSAGLIHPLCGNGMSMAIRSAEIACEELMDCFSELQDHAQALQNYRSRWKGEFAKRLRMGRIASGIFSSDTGSGLAMDVVRYVPGILPFFIKQTHGKVDKSLAYEV